MRAGGPMTSPETVVYRTVAGLPIRADVSVPAGDGPHPVIVFIHAGALIRGSREWIDPQQRAQYLEDGFAVVSIDYRLAPESKLPAIASDVDDAFGWVRGEGRERYDLDRDRLVVVGQSCGGFLTLLAGHRIRPRPQALVSFYGYGDIVGSWLTRPDPYYSQEPLVSEKEAYAAVGGNPLSAPEGPANEQRRRFYLYCRQQGLWPRAVGGHDPEREPEAFAPYCPIRNVTPEYPPTLLLHGDRDTDVPYQQSEMMAAALEKAGVEHELVIVRDGPHVFDAEPDRPEVAHALASVRAFLQQHV